MSADLWAWTVWGILMLMVLMCVVGAILFVIDWRGQK